MNEDSPKPVAVLLVGLLAVVCLMLTPPGSAYVGWFIHWEPSSFDNRYTLAPVSGAYRSIEIHSFGEFDEGGDQVVPSSQVELTLTANDGREYRRNLRYSYDQMLKADESYVRIGGSPQQLATWIASIPAVGDIDTLDEEARELSIEVKHACYGDRPRRKKLPTLEYFSAYWRDDE